MTSTKNFWKFNFLVLLFFMIFSQGHSQTIQPYFFGINAWMPDTIGDVNNCASPPCIKYGKLHANWQKVEDSRAQLVRYGGISPDKNKPTNYQYIRMVDSIRAHGMEPVLQVPYWDGRYSASQAAAIVQYVNVTRSRNVKYWVIGNEPDLKYGATNASHVASYIKAFSSAMKAVDSTIKIIGPETAWFNTSIINGLTTPGGTYDITGKDANGRYYIDVISFHTYPMGDNNSSLPTRASVISKLTSQGSFADDLGDLSNRLASANSYHGRSGTNALQMAVTEANVVYQNASNDNVYGLGANSFLGAQFVAELYGISMQKGVAFVNLWSVIEGNNVPASLGYVDHYTGVKKPLYYHYQMMADNFKGTSISATDNQTNVKVFASKHGQQTTVMILNQESSGTHNFTLRFNTAGINSSNSLKINVNAGIAAEYTSSIGNQSTVLMQFDGLGNLTKKCVYSLSTHAANNQPPTCTNIGSTDLVMNAASVSPSAAIAGATVALSSTIFNAGSSAAASSKVGYYLSTDSIADSGDHFLGFSSGAALNGGSGAQRQFTATIPSAKSAGNYYILFVADYNNDVAETNENNNKRPVTFTIQQAPVADLVIQSAGLTPTMVLPGGTTTLNAFVYNAGNTGANGGKTGYYLSTDSVFSSADTFLGFSAGSTLAAASGTSITKTVNISGTQAPGSYYILFAADYAGEVTESNEQNNLAKVKIQVMNLPVPDLSVSTASVSQSGAANGATFVLTSSVYNGGTGAASVSSMGYYLSTDTVVGSGDSFLGASQGGILNASAGAGRQFTATVPSGKSPGNYYILFAADHSNSVAESNENNNVKHVAFNILQASNVDLMISNAQSTPTNMLAGATVTLSSVIFNQGSNSAPGARTGYYLSSDNSFDNSDTFLGASPSVALSASAGATNTQTINIPSNKPAGSYYLLFYADDNAQVAESDEQNNLSAVGIYVSAPATAVDLRITAASVNPGMALSGGSVSLNSTIANSGTTSAAVSKVGYYLSTDTLLSGNDTFLGFSAGGALAAGSSSVHNSSVQIPGSQAAGNYYLLFNADHAADVAETNENNNVKAVALRIGQQPAADLTALNSSVAPGVIVAGDKMTMTGTLYNGGNLGVTSGKMGFYLSADTAFDQADTYLGFFNGYAVAAGSGVTKSFTFKTHVKQSPGNYYVLFVADHLQEVNESNEQNNLAHVAITIDSRKQDVAMKSFSLKSSKTMAGDFQETDLSITNEGNVELKVNTGYYLSSDSSYDISDVLLGSRELVLRPGQTATANTKVQIPVATFAGEYYMLAIADHDNLIEEGNESDNLKFAGLMVSESATGLSGAGEMAELNIFPNPSNGRFTIEVGNRGKQSTMVQVLDIGGRIVYSQNAAFSGNSEQIDLPSSVGAGVYIVRIYLPDGVVSKQILLNR